jgi:hypothetical protein
VASPPLLATVFSRIGETQAPLPAPVVLFLGLLVFVVVLGRALWRVAVHVNTIVHEAAHALVGLGAGRRIRSVNVNSNGGGDTDMVPKSGFGYGVAAFVGYVGPSAAGLMAAGLISIGRIVAALWLGLMLLAVMLLMVRNFFGGIAILVCGALLYLVVRYTTVGVETAVAYGATWFLLLSGLKKVLEVGSAPQDAKILAGKTRIAAPVWSFLWLLGSLAALAVGGAILL